MYVYGIIKFILYTFSTRDPELYLYTHNTICMVENIY